MDIIIRKAIHNDLDQIKHLSDQERQTIGFLTRETYKEAINSGNIFVATVDEIVVGFQYYYHRKRGLQTTLYQKTVAKEYRNLGIARLLVAAVIEEARLIGHKELRLKCPEGLYSNSFHKKMGFVLTGVEPGRKRKLNIWVLNI